MSLRPGNPFYFLFSPTGQQAIEATSIVVSDAPFSANPLASNPYPQSLRIQFSLKSGAGAPALRPLGPGLLTFRFDTDSGLQPPEPPDAVIENYDQWPTVGWLRLNFKDDKVIQRIQQITGLPVAPSDVWYSSIRLTKEFLFETLRKLPIGKVIADKKDSVPPDTPEALKQTISGFLKGRLFARLISGTQASGDSQVTLDMPKLAPIGADPSAFVFYVTTGFGRDPFDGEKTGFENPNNVADAWEPAHPRNGIIPARLVYRNLRTHALGNLIDANPGNPVPDRILATSAGTGVPDYYPVRFTRIWKAGEEFSVHFPSQVVSATHLGTGQRIQQRLAAHGILFPALTQLESLSGQQFSISLTNPSQKPEREMRWLTGGAPFVWEDPADTLPITVLPPKATQTPQTLPHLILRRRMAQEVLYDRRDRPVGVGPSCTFFSLRRTVRAFVNNRIAGGRLNFEVFYDQHGTHVQGKNSATTRSLVIEALGGPVAQVVLDGQPNHRAGAQFPEDSVERKRAINNEAKRLIPVFEKLFPRIIQPQPDDHFPLPDDTTTGKVAYLVWQSVVESFQGNRTRRLYAREWLGSGGAGSIVVVGLAGDYAVNPGQTTIRQPGETDESFRSRMVEDMLAGNLEPGAPLQFWNLYSDLEHIRDRQVPDDETDDEGHSPIFVKYVETNGVRTGITLLDQGGLDDVIRTGTPGNYILPWSPRHKPQVWIAANWLE